ISWVVNDGSGGANAGRNTGTRTVTDVHTAPVVTAGATVTFHGGGAAVGLDKNLAVSDSDSVTLASATVSIRPASFLAGDQLNFATQNGISGTYVSTTGVLTLSGTATVAQYQTALESITYSFTGGGDPTNAGADTTRTISWVVNDGSGGA